MQRIIRFPAFFTLTFFLFYNGFTASSPSYGSFSYCNNTFDCGAIREVTYPFTGGDRPDHCGLPEFSLTCRDESAELSLDSVTYKVLQLNQTSRTLTLARGDLWNSICPLEFRNSTVGSNNFHVGEGNEDLTLFYGCSGPSNMPYKPNNQFSCNINGSNSSIGYYWVGSLPSYLMLGITECNMSIAVPISKVVGARLAANETMLGEAIIDGFGVDYSFPYETNCSACLSVGGQCGYEKHSNLGEFMCYCSDQTCNTTGGSSKETPQVVGISIASAAIFGIFIGFLIFYFRNRRKKRVAKSESRDLPVTKLLKATDTPTTNYFQGNPPVPSSKFEFEKGSTYFGLQVFSYAELEEATGNFDSSRELGDGGFGTVYYGVLKDGRAVAVKRLYENNLKRVEQFINEVEILTHLRHQNLVVLYGCTSKQSRELLLVYEYIPNLTVADHLHGKKANSGLLTWQVRLKIAIETADALAYLHKSDIIHRDVKTTNILLDNSFRVKVADFGLSRLFPTDVTHVSTAPQGTPGYVDPEYYQCYQLTDKSDVYSFGVVLVELISSKPAVDTGRHRQEINLANMAINKIQSHALHELVDPSLPFESDYTVRRMATLVAELAFRCLQQERDMRPSMEEVVEMLREIEKEIYSAQKPEVVDIRVQEAGPTKNPPPPLSPDSAMTDKWASTSTTATSF